MKILYYAPYSFGGLADYAHEQANALVDLGHEVTVVCTSSFPSGRGEKYKTLQLLDDIKPEKAITNKLLKALHYTRVTLGNFSRLTQLIQSHGFKYVLFVSYSEYLAPLWFRSLKRLTKQGVVFGAVVQEPVRDFKVGPTWWHHWSIACGYSFLREAFVHETITLDTGRPMPTLRTTVIPYGTHHFPSALRSREETREALGLPPDARVLLAFGHIRDNKNLDLVIQALVDFPEIYLVVAGKRQSMRQRPESFYQELAQQLGVESRCRWKIEFISEAESANLFEACDSVLLTYRKTFRSASGVLNTAANYRKPCIASGGKGSLCSVVQKYNLGIWVEPDQVDAIKQGFTTLLNNPPQPEWERYFAENSWSINAKLVVDALSSAN